MPTEEKKHISTTTGLLIILAAAVIIGGGAIAYFYAMSPTSWDYMGNRTSVHKSSNANTNTSNTNSATADWKTYTNDTYGFSFKYPKDWTLAKVAKTQTTDEGITLNSPETAVKQKANTSPSPVGPDLSISWFANFKAFDASLAPAGKTETTINEWLTNVNAQNITKSINNNSVEFIEANMQADPPYSTAITTNDNGNIIVMNFLTDKSGLTENSKNILSTFQFTQ